MKFRSVDSELEAKLRGITGGLYSKASGKLERKAYAGSTNRLKIKLRGLGSRTNGVATIIIDGKDIVQISIESGSGNLDLESSGDGNIPNFEPGQIVEVSLDGSIILSGQLYED